MPDEQTEKTIRLLEEIRDLTKERNDQLDSYLQTTRQRYEEVLRHQSEAQDRALSQRRRFLWTLTPLLLLGIGFMAYLAFWAVPRSEQQQWQRQMRETLIMQSNYLSHPR